MGSDANRGSHHRPVSLNHWLELLLHRVERSVCKVIHSTWAEFAKFLHRHCYSLSPELSLHKGNNDTVDKAGVVVQTLQDFEVVTEGNCGQLWATSPLPSAFNRSPFTTRVAQLTRTWQKACIRRQSHEIADHRRSSSHFSSFTRVPGYASGTLMLAYMSRGSS